MQRNRTRRKNAFTLVEILIVVVILGILAAIVVPQFTNAADQARQSSLDSTVRTIRSALELSRNNTGSYPAFSDDLWNTLQTQGLLQDAPTNPLPAASNANTNANTPGAATVGAAESGADFEIFLNANGALVVQSGV